MDKISRRQLFKRIARILPAIALSIIPTISVSAFSTSVNDCRGGCAGTCTGLCAVGCKNACLGSCQYTCNKMCRDACTGCLGSCKTSTIKMDSVKLKRNKQ